MNEALEMLSVLSENIDEEISAESSTSSRDKQEQVCSRRQRVATQFLLKPHSHLGPDDREVRVSEGSATEPARELHQSQPSERGCLKGSGSVKGSTKHPADLVGKGVSSSKTNFGNNGASRAWDRTISPPNVGRTRCSSESNAVDLNKYIIKQCKSENSETDNGTDPVTDCISNARIAVRRRQSSACTELEYRHNQRRLAELHSQQLRVSYCHQNGPGIIQRIENFGVAPSIDSHRNLKNVASVKPPYWDIRCSGNVKERGNISQGRQIRNRVMATVQISAEANCELEKLDKAINRTPASLSQAAPTDNYRGLKNSTQTKYSDLMHPETIRENISSTNSSRSGKQTCKELFISGPALSVDAAITETREDNMLQSGVEFNMVSERSVDFVIAQRNDITFENYHERDCSGFEQNLSIGVTLGSDDRGLSVNNTYACESSSHSLISSNDVSGIRSHSGNVTEPVSQNQDRVRRFGSETCKITNINLKRKESDKNSNQVEPLKEPQCLELASNQDMNLAHRTEHWSDDTNAFNSTHFQSIPAYCKTAMEDKLSDYEDILDVQPGGVSPEILDVRENGRDPTYENLPHAANRDGSNAAGGATSSDCLIVASQASWMTHENIHDTDFFRPGIAEHSHRHISSIPVQATREPEVLYSNIPSHLRSLSHDRPRMGMESVFAKSKVNHASRADSKGSIEAKITEESLHYASTNLLGGNFGFLDNSIITSSHIAHFELQREPKHTEMSQPVDGNGCIPLGCVTPESRSDNPVEKSTVLFSTPELDDSHPSTLNRAKHNFNLRFLSCPDSEIHSNTELRGRKQRSLFRRAFSAIASHLSLTKRGSKLIRTKSSLDDACDKNQLIRKHSAPPRFDPCGQNGLTGSPAEAGQTHIKKSPPQLREKYSIPYSEESQQGKVLHQSSFDFSHNGKSRCGSKPFAQMAPPVDKSFIYLNGKHAAADLNGHNSTDNSVTKQPPSNCRSPDVRLSSNGVIRGVPQNRQMQQKSGSKIVANDKPTCASDATGNRGFRFISQKDDESSENSRVKNSTFSSTVMDVIRAEKPEFTVDIGRDRPQEADNVSIESRYDNVLESGTSQSFVEANSKKHSKQPNIPAVYSTPQGAAASVNTSTTSNTHRVLVKQAKINVKSTQAPNYDAEANSDKTVISGVFPNIHSIANHQEEQHESESHAERILSSSVQYNNIDFGRNSFITNSQSKCSVNEFTQRPDLNRLSERTSADLVGGGRSHVIVQRTVSEGTAGILHKIISSPVTTRHSEKSKPRRLRSDTAKQPAPERRPQGFDRIRIANVSLENSHCNAELVLQIQPRTGETETELKQFVSGVADQPSTGDMITLPPVVTVRDVISRSISAPQPNLPSQSSHNPIFRFPDSNNRNSSSSEDESENEFFGSSFDTNISPTKLPAGGRATFRQEGPFTGRGRVKSGSRGPTPTIREIILDNFESTMTSQLAGDTVISNYRSILPSHHQHQSKSETSGDVSHTALAVSRYLQSLSGSQWTTFGSLVNSFLACAEASVNPERLQESAQQFTKGLSNYLLNGNDRDFNRFLREQYPLVSLDDNSVREGIRSALKQTVKIQQQHRPTSFV